MSIGLIAILLSTLISKIFVDLPLLREVVTYFRLQEILYKLFIIKHVHSKRFRFVSEQSWDQGKDFRAVFDSRSPLFASAETTRKR